MAARSRTFDLPADHPGDAEIRPWDLVELAVDRQIPTRRLHEAPYPLGS